MAGQFKTRRGASGRLERVPEEDQETLKQEAGVLPPDLPEDRPGALTQADVDFVDANRDQGGEAVEPPPIPPVDVQPQQLAPDDTQGEQPGPGDVVGDVAGGAVKGARLGGLPGAVVGAGVGFLAGRSGKRSRVGSLEGPGGSTQDETASIMKQLLAVQQGIARVGSPIKDAVTTNAIGSRM
jgi:hypothetical protein